MNLYEKYDKWDRNDRVQKLNALKEMYHECQRLEEQHQLGESATVVKNAIRGLWRLIKGSADDVVDDADDFMDQVDDVLGRPDVIGTIRPGNEHGMYLPGVWDTTPGAPPNPFGGAVTPPTPGQPLPGSNPWGDAGPFNIQDYMDESHQYQQLDESAGAVIRGIRKGVEGLWNWIRTPGGPNVPDPPKPNPFDITQQPGHGVNRPDLYDDIIDAGDNVVYGRPDFAGPPAPDPFADADAHFGDITPDDWTYHGPTKPPNPFDITQHPDYGKPHQGDNFWPFDDDNPFPGHLPGPDPLPFNRKKKR